MKVKDIIFLGTGCSSNVPVIGCLTDPNPKCKVCLSTQTLKGKKNVRRNTSLIVILQNDENEAKEERTVLIDCGKTFYQAALEWFPYHGLRRIDAVILTHPHADAINGLDDLRGWTLRGVVQDYIPIYADSRTISEVSHMFPYLVDVKNATGGGDLPTFRWNTIDSDEPFNLFGVKFIPLLVEHGVFFNTIHPTPYMCLGFRFEDITYLSDVSKIPPSTKKLIDGSKLLVIDCLREDHFISHFGLHDCAETAWNMSPTPPKRIYLVGLSHKSDHDEWTSMCEKRYGVNGSLIDPIKGKSPLLIQPAYDGLRIPVEKIGMLNGH